MSSIFPLSVAKDAYATNAALPNYMFWYRIG
jgi:hypothetical protein